MYNGQPLPLEAMQEWLRETITSISPDANDSVLEIGVGTGMIALNLVDQVGSYVGTDISAEGLNFLGTLIRSRSLEHKMSVFEAAAHDLEKLAIRKVSLVVINSVAQYFPSAEYFTQVIKNIIDMMEDGGRIYIGDVRSYSLISFHDVERSIASMEPSASLEDLRENVARLAEVQTELLVDPSFFFALQHRFPSITHVEIKPKVMQARNELSRYRYTAILHVNRAVRLTKPSVWLDFSSHCRDIAGLETLLTQTQEHVIGIVGIPVMDVQKVGHIFSLLGSDDSPHTVLSPSQMLKDDPLSNYSITTALRDLAEVHGWYITFDYSFQGRPANAIRAIFARHHQCDTSPLIGDFPLLSTEGSSHNVVASPSSRDATAVLDSIKEHLRLYLPAIMVPAHLFTLEKLPMNQNGKLDRKLLSSASFFQSQDTSREPTKPIGPL